MYKTVAEQPAILDGYLLLPAGDLTIEFGAKTANDITNIALSYTNIVVTPISTANLTT